jgi:hypothetical protein
MRRVAESAERVTTAVVAYVGDGGGKRRSMIDYLGEAMVNDACATALASLWMLRRALSRFATEPMPLNEIELRVIRDIEKALESIIEQYSQQFIPRA